ncbi:unnamed protein product [Spirodela intermedia]|uniref:Uncharacterized protein n=1 Tax=Spirodela intermedia TaxID=51605 RepID=A0ABN7EC13_SPIIN|nr:unnamed protein product [Spirodela intermedia]
MDVEDLVRIALDGIKSGSSWSPATRWGPSSPSRRPAGLRRARDAPHRAFILHGWYSTIVKWNAQQRRKAEKMT